MKGVLLYLMLIICVAYLGAHKFRCDYSYTNVGWLKYHEIPATWYDARLRCRFEGGMLASPTSIELKAAMLNKIRFIDIFTGIHATVSPGSYYTIDGKPLESMSRSWAEGEPDNKNNAERCIAMNFEGNFSDVSCDIPRPYICHRANSSESVNICGTLDSEYSFEQRTNKCYKFHLSPRTFNRAHFVCSAEGGHLAIINSQIESKVISDIFALYPEKLITSNFKYVAFIGYSNCEESADWTTVDGQTLKEAGFDKFAAGQPNNVTPGQYCGSVQRNGLLNDLWCEGHYPFICEKDPNYPAICNSEDFYDSNEDLTLL